LPWLIGKTVHQPKASCMHCTERYRDEQLNANLPLSSIQTMPTDHSNTALETGCTMLSLPLVWARCCVKLERCSIRTFFLQDSNAHYSQPPVRATSKTAFSMRTKRWISSAAEHSSWSEGLPRAHSASSSSSKNSTRSMPGTLHAGPQCQICGLHQI
jgi:hypothetical protein